MSVIKFGTDGWRAIIAKEFTFENIKIVTQGIACYLKSTQHYKKGVVVAYDNRFLSEKFADECARVLAGNGIRVLRFIKAVPTPLAAFAIRQLDAGGAIMITASHNPSDYNGIKFIPEYAGPALPEVTSAIEDEVNRILNGGKVYEIDLHEALPLDLLTDIDLDKEYSTHLLRMINPDFIKEKPLRVVVDPMYGAGISYLDRILSELGIEVKTINNYRDPLFGGTMPEPTDAILGDLKRAVQSYQADLGLALDGDADRFGIIDADGDFITPNQFSYLLFDHLVKTRTYRGPVCRSIATTHMLDKIARENGLTAIETPVGFKYIGACMREKGCMMGIEESGGLTVFGHVPEKDGILACLLAVEIMAYSGKSFKQLKADLAEKYGNICSERTDIKTTEAIKTRVLAELGEWQPRIFAGVKVERINELEGKQLLLEDGSWILIRSSGTEPLFRIYCEASSPERIRELKNEVIKQLSL
jgi:alpha-D-glucose phosphate-specific phosphoglucomutase